MTDAQPAPAGAPRPDTPRTLARAVALSYLAALLLVFVLVVLAGAIPLLAQNLYLLVAAVFVGIPYWLLRRRDADFDAFGLTWQNAGRGALWGVLFSVLTLVPFALGYAWWQQNVLRNRLEFAADNYFQWPIELQGRPAAWNSENLASHDGAQAPGVWVWAENNVLMVGMVSAGAPIAVTMQAGEPLAPVARGPVQVVIDSPAGAKAPQAPAHSVVARVDEPNARARLVLARHEGRAPPRALRISAKDARTGQSIAIAQGPGATLSDAPIELARGVSWIFLWVLTQLVFIALPEEFFYRGYVMTQLRRIFDARRGISLNSQLEDSLPEDANQSAHVPRRRRFLLISAENAITSVLFALGHLLIPIGGVLLVGRAAVFFPSLAFGWLRERTGTIAAPVVYHAAANMMVLLAAPHFY